MLKILDGKKTYLVSIGMLAWALSSYIMDRDRTIDWKFVLEALGLSALRAGVAKAQPPNLNIICTLAERALAEAKAESAATAPQTGDRVNAELQTSQTPQTPQTTIPK